ncbi:hypothetical protein [Listeria kieliensis]
MLFFMILFILVLFSGLLQNIIPVMGTINNLIGFLFMGLALYKVFYQNARGRKTITRTGIWVILTVIVLFMIALIPNLALHEHNLLKEQVITFYGDIKFLIIFFCGKYFFGGIDLRVTVLWMKRISLLFTISCFLAYGLNLVVPFLDSFDTRFGIHTYSFGFGHPAQFALVVIIFSAIRFLFALLEKTTPPYVYLISNFVLIFIAGRSTSIGFYICFLILAFVLPYLKRIPFSFAGILGAVFIWFAWDRIMNQIFGSTGEARGLLLRTSIQIAKEHFPFGAGLGMFGSHAARVHYSPLFARYNLDSVWGLSPNNPQFATDSYWAMIIGELGFLGAICMLILFGLTIGVIWVGLKNLKSKIKMIVVLPFFYAIITSPIDTIMASKSIVIVMFAVLYMFFICENSLENTSLCGDEGGDVYDDRDF